MAEQPNTFFLPGGILDDEESDGILELTQPFTDHVSESNSSNVPSTSAVRPPPGFNTPAGFPFAVGTGTGSTVHRTAKTDPLRCDASFFSSNSPTAKVGTKPAPIGSGRSQQSSWYTGRSSALFGGVETTQHQAPVDKISGLGLGYSSLHQQPASFELTRPSLWSEATSGGATVRTSSNYSHHDGSTSIAPPPGFSPATRQYSDEHSFLYNRNPAPSSFSICSVNSQPFVGTSSTTQRIPSSTAPRFVPHSAIVEEEDNQIRSSDLSLNHAHVNPAQRRQLGGKIDDQILETEDAEAGDDHLVAAADTAHNTSIPRNVSIIVKDDEMSVVSVLSEGTLHTTTTANEHHNNNEPKMNKQMTTGGLGSFSKTGVTGEESRKKQSLHSTASINRRKQATRSMSPEDAVPTRGSVRDDERECAVQNQRKKSGGITEHVYSTPIPKSKDHRGSKTLARKDSQVAGQGSCEAPDRSSRERGDNQRNIKPVSHEDEEDREEEDVVHDDDTATVPLSSSAYRATKNRIRQRNSAANANHEQQLLEDESAFTNAPNRDRVGSIYSLDSTSSPPRDRTISDSSISTPKSPVKHKGHKRSKHRKKVTSAAIEDMYLKKKHSSCLSSNGLSQRSKPGVETVEATQSTIESCILWVYSSFGLKTLWKTVQTLKYRKIAVSMLQYSCTSLIHASKWVAHILYNSLKAIFFFVVLLHKLALKEVVNNQVGFFCYTFCTSYRSIMSFLSEYWITPHWFPQFFWICVVGAFCTRPKLSTGEERKRTHQRLKRNREAEQILMKIVRGGKSGAKARKEAAKLSLRAFSDLDLDTYTAGTTNEKENSPACFLTCSSLSFEIVRILLLVLWALETATDANQGIIMELTGSEQVLVGFTLASIKLGYICSPIVWISWSIQVLIVTFWPSNFVLEHFLLLMGLATLHLISKVADRSILFDGDSEEVRVEVDRNKVLLDRKRK